MFTIKFYSESGFRQRILEAESFTILRDQSGGAEITLHQKNSNDDIRMDVRGDASDVPSGPPTYNRAIIENAAGKTTEIVTPSPFGAFKQAA